MESQILGFEQFEHRITRFFYGKTLPIIQK